MYAIRSYYADAALLAAPRAGHLHAVTSGVITSYSIHYTKLYELARSQFGFLLDALQFGAPPHGGIAFGLDRLTMIMAGATSIRDVIAFPKTQRGTCLMTESPSDVSTRQLRELHIKLRERPQAAQPQAAQADDAEK